MADITITDLDADTGVAESDLFLKRTSGGADYKTTAGKIKDYVKNALINEGTGASSFSTVAQISKASGVALTSGTSTVKGSSTVDVWSALKTYGSAKKSNATAYLSGIEIGDIGYTKIGTTSYSSQVSVELVFVYNGGRGYAHIIPKLKTQESYTMYMNTANSALDGVWRKDTEKILTEEMYPPTNKPFIIGNKEDKVIGACFSGKFGTQESTYMAVYHPKTGEPENNMLIGSRRNTVIGSGILTHDTFYNGGVQNDTAKKTLYLCGQDEIKFYTGSSDNTAAKKSTLDANGNLTTAGSIYSNGAEVPTFNFSKIYISTQSKDSSGVQSYPYHLLAYREFNIKGKNCHEEFFFDVNFLESGVARQCKCKLTWNTTYTSSTTATSLVKVPTIAILQISGGDASTFFKGLKVRYTHTSNSTLKIWIYMDFSERNCSWYTVSLIGGVDVTTSFAITPNGRDWTYYQKTSATTAENCYATMEGATDGGETTYETMDTGSLSVHNLLTSVNGNFTNSLTVAGSATINNPANIYKVGDITDSTKTISVEFRASGTDTSKELSFVVKKPDGTSTFNSIIDRNGNLAINRARVSTSEPATKVNGDMWFA